MNVLGMDTTYLPEEGWENVIPAILQHVAINFELGTDDGWRKFARSLRIEPRLINDATKEGLPEHEMRFRVLDLFQSRMNFYIEVPEGQH